MILKLKPPKYHGYRQASFKVSRPFVANARGKLVHRPRSISRHNNGAKHKRHMAVTYYCGGSATGTNRFTFLHRPDKDTTVCALCEVNATQLKLPTTKALGGDAKQIGLLSKYYEVQKEKETEVKDALRKLHLAIETEATYYACSNMEVLNFAKKLLPHIQTANAFLKFR